MSKAVNVSLQPAAAGKPLESASRRDVSSVRVTDDIIGVFESRFYFEETKHFVNKEAMEIRPHDHHKQSEFCYSRPPYRQGKEFKAVKVYTINDESQHLLIQNVPSIGLLEEIKRLTSKFGKTDEVKLVENYPDQAEFTHTFYVKYRLFKEARQAKKKLDNRSFFGNILHVFYAPELESVEECRKKLFERFNFSQRLKRKNLDHPERDTSNIKRFKNTTTQPELGSWSHLLPSSSTTILPLPSNSNSGGKT